MREYRGIKYHLNDSPAVGKGRDFMYALEGDKFFTMLKAKTLKEAELEVKQIITKIKNE